MNKETRKRLDTLYDTLSKLQSAAEDVRSELETIKDEEQEKYDNLPENLQESERGQALEAVVEALDNADSSLSNVESEITDALGYIDEAKE